ncbi:MAG: hypothetical protein EKK29_20190 [Hyphomicrobiales bacterium]|nr:MAG: hypothetical protein EKK29_20190 [Hyphomicrobiales bacterium]
MPAKLVSAIAVITVEPKPRRVGAARRGPPCSAQAIEKSPLSPTSQAGEAIIERFLQGDGPFRYSPTALMRALLVQTWRPCSGNGRDPAVGWALGAIIPDFDDLARPLKRRIYYAVVAALPLSFRPALLAAVAQATKDPVILDFIWEETTLRGRLFERLCETAWLGAQAVKQSHLT